MEQLERKRQENTPMPRAEADKISGKLSELHKRLKNDPIDNLSEGQLVQWKEGLRNKRRPRYGEPAVLVEFLKSPVFDEENGSGSAYFHEPLDVVLGFLDDDGDFVLFHYDKRRFKPFE